MLAQAQTKTPNIKPWHLIPSELKTVAVFATVDNERVKVDFMRGSDKYGWWVVKPIKGGEWYFCRREDMTNITRQFKLVKP